MSKVVLRAGPCPHEAERDDGVSWMCLGRYGHDGPHYAGGINWRSGQTWEVTYLQAPGEFVRGTMRDRISPVVG